ncbi:hypothetical protein [Roseomonas populi]|uniref:FXSXX-COOH protein n=1 Tax=Roseomonas populi TaxID=3121582 RepID=A0ABT1X198_9PROT|nr:hypothetical protein [Roseomonas pecuniae]MCR0981504.1 hypothetical protein [Roseomonas pecuniae]
MTEKSTVIRTTPKEVADSGRVSTGGLQRTIVRTAPKAVADSGRVSTGGLQRAI